MADQRANISSKVKESGFFTGTSNIDVQSYHKLYDPYDGRPRIEVDTSICYSASAVSQITEYNPNMKLVLIFRHPEEFLISRYIHSFRKGEVSEANAADALTGNDWLKAELDYPAIFERFSDFGSNLLVLDYKQIQSDQQSAYNAITAHLGLAKNPTFQVNSDRVNQARRSKFPLATHFLTNGAKIARSLGLHWLVNTSKSLALHTLLETSVESGFTSETCDRDELRRAILAHTPQSLDFYSKL